LSEKLNSTISLIETFLRRARNPHILFWPNQRSVLCVYLIQKYLPTMPPILLIDTKLIFEEVHLFAQKLKKLWRLNIVKRSYEDERDSVMEKVGGVNCCLSRKSEVLKKAILDLNIDRILSGIKPDVLKLQWCPGAKIEDGESTVFNPTLDLSDSEILLLSKELNLPRCSLWQAGIMEPECSPCTSLPGPDGKPGSYSDDRQEVIQRLKSLGYC